MVFTNAQCTKQYGSPRHPADVSKLMSQVSEEHRQKRRIWLANIAQVSPPLHFNHMQAIMHTTAIVGSEV